MTPPSSIYFGCTSIRLPTESLPAKNQTIRQTINAENWDPHITDPHSRRLRHLCIKNTLHTHQRTGNQCNNKTGHTGNPSFLLYKKSSLSSMPVFILYSRISSRIRISSSTLFSVIIRGGTNRITSLPALIRSSPFFQCFFRHFRRRNTRAVFPASDLFLCRPRMQSCFFASSPQAVFSDKLRFP